MALTKIGTDGVKDDAITSDKIPANAVGASELAQNAVGSANIIDGSILQGDLSNNVIGSAQIADDTITTVKILDSNVTEAKLANSAVATAKVADNAITTPKIADENITLAKLEHGTSSNDGKFLRANNGADPTFETVTGTTINSNADNRVITGSGSADTLNGESTLTYDASLLNITSTTQGLGTRFTNTGNEYTEARFDAARTGAGSALGIITGRWNNQHNVAQIYLQSGDDTTNKDDGRISFLTQSESGTSGTRLRIEPNGKVGINETSPQQQLHVHDDTAYQGILINGNGAPRVAFARSTTTTGEWSVGIDGTNGNDFCINNSNDNSARKVIVSSAGLTASGVLVSGGNTTAYGDFIVATAGKGLSFAATSDASGMSSEILDDYEEGTFTPTNATVGLSTANGRYTKIGNIVSFDLQVVFNNNSSAVAGYIDGLPYTSADNWSGSYPHSLTIGYATGNHIQFALLSGGSDRIYLYDKNGSSVQSTHFDNDDVRVGGTYIVA